MEGFKKITNSILQSFDEKILFITAPLLLKKSAWVGIVYKDNRDIFTTYAYCDINGYDYWQDMTRHPKYNSHDGMYSGLPKSLVKIWNEHGLKNAYDKLSQNTPVQVQDIWFQKQKALF